MVEESVQFNPLLQSSLQFHLLYGSKFPWSRIFVILPDFRDSVIFKCPVLYYKLLLRKFRDENFRDPSEIHENHKNIRPRKFGAIRYVHDELNNCPLLPHCEGLFHQMVINKVGDVLQQSCRRRHCWLLL